MKPSERIKEIMLEISKETGSNWTEHKIGAIWRYLDEEWEKNKTCAHEPNGDMLSNGCYECRKCRVMYVN